jgi:hypothetical protein
MQAAVERENEPQMRNVTDEQRVEAIMALFNKVKLRNQ